MYYCVTDLKLTGKDLQLVDIGTPGPPLVFSTSNRTDLAQSPDTSDAPGHTASQPISGLGASAFCFR